jgi:hypothetical protein
MHVGVVCVHGIGFQHPGQTLLEWTGPIATALVAWRGRITDDDLDEDDRAWPRDLVECSDVDLTGERPSYVTFRITGVTTVEGAARSAGRSPRRTGRPGSSAPSLRLLIDWTGREGVVDRVVQAPRP